MTPEAPLHDAWKQAAACRNPVGVSFYPETELEARAATRICAGCAVRRVCLDTALRNGERFGVWGGLTERERMALGHLRHRAA